MSVINIEKKHIQAGIFAGIIAGVVFGTLMGMMGMLPMIAKLLNGNSAFFGFVLHLIFSAIIGLIFSIFLGHAAANKTRGAGLGLLYGLIWWFLGPLIIMPSWLGMGMQVNAEGIKMALPSLWGHLVYGLILGFMYPIVVTPKKTVEETVAE